MFITLDFRFSIPAIKINNEFALIYAESQKMKVEIDFNNSSEKQFQALLDVLHDHEDINLIFTMPNADLDGRVIIRMIEKFVLDHDDRSIAFTSMGQLNYLSTMQFVDGVIGNSSSGLLEAPSFQIGTINIGDRQKGRLKAKSIIDCEPTKKKEAEGRGGESLFTINTPRHSTLRPYLFEIDLQG